MADTRQAQRRRQAAARAAGQSEPVPAPAVGGRATGWKIPLLFCAAILIVVAFVWGWRRHAAPPALDISPALLEIAGQSRIDLEADAGGRRYREDLIAAGRGFAASDVRDRQVEAVARRAMEDGRLDVAVMGSQVLRDQGRRDELLKSLAGACMKDCAMLPWGVYAVRNMQDHAAAVELARGLNGRWEQCLAQGTPPRPTTSETFAPRDADPPAAGAAAAAPVAEQAASGAAPDAAARP